jgi:hypothetical protein
MFENYTLEEKIEAFDKALNSMNFRPEFQEKLRNVILEISSRINDLKPINITRGLSHVTLLSSHQAQEVADRFFEYLTEGKHKTSFERIFPKKLSESDIKRIVSKVLNG